jgi:hypothetical protein
MNFGFNSNVHVGEALYHVQTEDRGPLHPYLDTVVYEAGRVVYKLSTNYADFADGAAKDKDLAQQLHEWLSLQHRNVIAQLESRTLTLRGFEKFSPEPIIEEVPTDGIDVRLTNSKSWFAAGNVILDIELRRRQSAQEVVDAEVEALVERERERDHCGVARTDASGKATLKFPMPSMASDGASLVIRATDGDLYGELRFRIKSKQPPTALASESK